MDPKMERMTGLVVMITGIVCIGAAFLIAAWYGRSELFLMAAFVCLPGLVCMLYGYRQWKDRTE